MVVAVETRQQRGFVETLYRSVAGTFLVSPRVAWGDPRRVAVLRSQHALETLVETGERLQRDATALLDRAAFDGDEIASAAVATEVRFATDADRSVCESSRRAVPGGACRPPRPRQRATNMSEHIFNESNALGWLQGMMDLVAYVETGQFLHRHYDGCVAASTGMVYRQTDAGLRVHSVAAGTFADEAGMQPGDLLVRLAGVGVFRRSDVWTVNGLVPPGTEVQIEYVRAGELRTGSGHLSPVALRVLGE